MARRKTPQDLINLADSTCDPNARHVTAFSCQNLLTGSWGCITVDGGNVPQLGEFVIIGHIPGTSPVTIGGILYTHQPTFWLITSVQPANPNLVGNQDVPTINIPGNTACGFECDNNGCYWTGLPYATYQSWNECATAVNAGACTSTPTHFCDDYNVFEIIYPGTTYTGSTGMTEAIVLSEIISRTTTPVSGIPIPYPYHDHGGIWTGLSLTQIFNTTGTPAVGGTSIYHPLGSSLDDCIACCGGINQQFDSNGAVNPYYGMTTHPTPHMGYAAYLSATALTQNSATFTSYMSSLGVNSCGQTVS